MNRIAEAYVRLVLALGSHDPDYVDAYYGRPDWKSEEESRRTSIAEIRDAATTLAGHVESQTEPADKAARQRQRYLARMLRSVAARAAMLCGARYTFDQESEALYGAVAPQRGDDFFRETLDALEKELPGAGPLVDRYDAFQKRLLISPDRLGRVFKAAIDEARRRTAQHIPLPHGESFRIEYVADRPWSGYNWYQGNFASLIQVNTDLPIAIDRAIDLAAHEGYPGHHVYHALCERNLVRDRGWVEFTIYPLFSPQSLIAEGSANFGVEVVFGEEDRRGFEREVLFPLAGLDPESADANERVRNLVDRLASAGNEAARRLVNGEIGDETASAWLAEFALMSRPKAQQRIRFIRRYRSYVINYNLGKDLVREFVESRCGRPASPDRRWKELAGLLSSPRLPWDLKATNKK
jgi:hypothetical protein